MTEPKKLDVRKTVNEILEQEKDWQFAQAEWVKANDAFNHAQQVLAHANNLKEKTKRPQSHELAMAQELKSLWNGFVDDSSFKIVRKDLKKPLSFFNMIIDNQWTEKLFGKDAYWLINSQCRSLNIDDQAILTITDSGVGCNVTLEYEYRKIVRWEQDHRFVDTCFSLEELLEELAEDIKYYV